MNNGKEENPGGSPFNLGRALAAFERGFLENILQLARGDLQRAAEMLEISKSELLKKLEGDDPATAGETWMRGRKDKHS